MDEILFLGYEALVATVPFLLTLIICRYRQVKKGNTYSLHRLTMMAVFTIYIAGVLHFTGAGTLYDGLMYQLELRLDQINFIPFSHDIDIAAYLLNILLFIPLGILAPVIWQKMNKLPNILGTGLVFTTLIEVSQLANNRRTDIDDVLLNVLGAVLGFGIFKLLNKATNSKFQVNNPAVAELIICIVTVFVSRFLLFNEMGLAKLLYGF